jgi:two-component system sensor histidine kinase UhpB
MQEAMRSRGLHTQILAVNSVLMVAAILATAVTARSGIDGGVDRRQWLVLGAALLTTVLVNALVLARRLKPLGELLATMERVDLSSPGLRASALREDSADAVRLKDAFNRMLARLEQERASAGRAILRAQEDERARVARDLHDECNQALTAVLLRLGASVQHAPPELVAELRETQVVAGRAMDELLRLAHELRPTALDDLGLEAALHGMVERFSVRDGPRGTLSVAGGLDGLAADTALVVYRVVQEALSNVTRHAGARGVHVDVLARGARAAVRVTDDGRGFRPGAPAGEREPLGLIGMRERALLAGGTLTVSSAPGHGTSIELEVGGPPSTARVAA